MSTKAELEPGDIVTLMAACAIAADRFPDATEYEAMRVRLRESSVVTIETPTR